MKVIIKRKGSNKIERYDHAKVAVCFEEKTAKEYITVTCEDGTDVWIDQSQIQIITFGLDDEEMPEEMQGYLKKVREEYESNSKNDL